MNIEPLVKQKYLPILHSIQKVVKFPDIWELLSNLAFHDCLNENWVETLDAHLVQELSVHFKLEDANEAGGVGKDYKYLIERKDRKNDSVLPAKDRSKEELSMHKFADNVEDIYYVLPYMRKDFVPNVRFFTDVILSDAKEKRSTDVHFDCESMFDGNFRRSVKFREGIYLVEQKKYKITNTLVEDIIADTVTNRSTSGNKLTNLAIDSQIRFRLVDPLFPGRCQVAKSIGGKTLNIRLFDFHKAPTIETLGFSNGTQAMLYRMSETPNGLTLVSGVFGSGKGTTLNAVAQVMEEHGRFGLASLDDPIEYLRKFRQYEYATETQLNEYIEGIKKMDLNAVFLNEIITEAAAKGVYNLVSSGVHVLTTIHTNRVFRLMYKLQELLGDKYLNLIPFLNVISYQDKFSVVCPHCKVGIDKEKFSRDSVEFKFLTAMGLDILNQPEGCTHCNNGIIPRGIKVVSEHIEMTDKLKSKLLRLNIHEQGELLKEEVKKGENLEDIMREALRDGSILLREALVKLDTWE
jgi:type II secretory ATPase GspE/PulE/Tfp pilus assembly ATPase PilB-like protein